jgi:MoaA/NifB/PqqE/SkfB family radical SAM enzyme
LSDSKNLCILPWIHRFTNEQGYHQVCCTAIGDNLLRDAHGSALHVSDNLTDGELLNSPDLKAIRVAMLNNEWPATCERCRRTEEAGSTSFRQHVNTQFGHWTEGALSQTAQDGTIGEPHVRYADIRLGNACNLTCRMCGPWASRLWADHHNQLQPARYQLPIAHLESLRTNNWVKRQPVQWLIEQCLPSVDALHFAGGEPLIIPEMLEALETCVRAGRASQIDLSYNTNITVIPEQVTRLWPQFRSVSLICSVDGFGKVNEYIRRPSKWSDIDRNLQRLDRHFDEWRLRFVGFNTTVQVYNVLQLGELFEYLASGFRNVASVPQLMALYHPSYLSIRNLPARAKAIARERLLAARAEAELRVSEKLQPLLRSIDGVLAYMEEDSRSRDFADFLYFSERSDREFGESWRTACPELSRALQMAD